MKANFIEIKSISLHYVGTKMAPTFFSICAKPF